MNPDSSRARTAGTFAAAVVVALMLLLIMASALYESETAALEQTTYLTPGERNSSWGLHAGMLAAGPVGLALLALAGWRFMRPRHRTPAKPQVPEPGTRTWAPAPGEQFVAFHRSHRVQIVLTVLVAVVALGCVLGTVGTWESGLTGGWAAQRRRDVLLGLLLGPMMVAVVAALLGWINPWVFSNKGHAVVVGESGLFVNVPGCSVGQVAWDEIRSVEVRKINHVRYLAVEVTDPEKVVDRSGSRVVGMNFSAYGTPVIFQLFRIRGWRHQLAPALQRFRPSRHDEGSAFSHSA